MSDEEKEIKRLKKLIYNMAYQIYTEAQNKEKYWKSQKSRLVLTTQDQIKEKIYRYENEAKNAKLTMEEYR